MKFTLRSNLHQAKPGRRFLPVLARVSHVLAIRNMNGRSSDARPA
jgi:hypothetical protein